MGNLYEFMSLHGPWVQTGLLLNHRKVWFLPPMPGFVLCRFYHGDSCWFNEVQQIIETWWGCFSHGMDVRSSGFPCLCRNDASPGRWESSCAACLAIRDQQEETQQSSKRLFKNKNSINKLQIWMRPSWGIRLEPFASGSGSYGYIDAFEFWISFSSIDQMRVKPMAAHKDITLFLLRLSVHFIPNRCFLTSQCVFLMNRPLLVCHAPNMIMFPTWNAQRLLIAGSNPVWWTLLSQVCGFLDFNHHILWWSPLLFQSIQVAGS
jgi:hypothetical protein